MNEGMMEEDDLKELQNLCGTKDTGLEEKFLAYHFILIPLTIFTDAYVFNFLW